MTGDPQLSAELRSFEERTREIYDRSPAPCSYVLLEALRKAREHRQREKRKGLLLLAVVLLFAALVGAQAVPLDPWRLVLLLAMSLAFGLRAAVPALVRAFEEDAERQP